MDGASQGAAVPKTPLPRKPTRAGATPSPGGGVPAAATPPPGVPPAAPSPMPMVSQQPSAATSAPSSRTVSPPSVLSGSLSDPASALQPSAFSASLPAAPAPADAAPAPPGVVPFHMLADPSAAELKIRALEASLKSKEGELTALPAMAPPSLLANSDGVGELYGSALDVDLAANESALSPPAQIPSAARISVNYTTPAYPAPPAYATPAPAPPIADSRALADAPAQVQARPAVEVLQMPVVELPEMPLQMPVVELPEMPTQPAPAVPIPAPAMAAASVPTPAPAPTSQPRQSPPLQQPPPVQQPPKLPFAADPSALPPAAASPPPPKFDAASDVSAASNASATNWERLVSSLKAQLGSRDDRLARTVGLIESLAREMEDLNARLVAGRENEDRLVRSHRVLRSVYQARIEGLKGQVAKLQAEAEQARAELARAVAEAEAGGAAAAGLGAAGAVEVARLRGELERAEAENEALGGKVAALEQALERAAGGMEKAVQETQAARLGMEEARKEAVAARAEAEAARREAAAAVAMAAAASANGPTLVQGPPVAESPNQRPFPSQESGLASAVGEPKDAATRGTLVPNQPGASSMAADAEPEEDEMMDLAFWREQAKLAEKGLAGPEDPVPPSQLHQQQQMASDSAATAASTPAPAALPFASSSARASLSSFAAPRGPASLEDPNASISQASAAPAAAAAASSAYVSRAEPPPPLPSGPANPASDPLADLRALATVGTKMLLVKPGSSKKELHTVRLVPREGQPPVVAWSKAEGGFLGIGKPKEEAEPLVGVSATRDPKTMSLQLLLRTPSRDLVFQPASPRDLGAWVRTAREVLRRAAPPEAAEDGFRTGLARYEGAAGGMVGAFRPEYGQVKSWALTLA